MESANLTSAFGLATADGPLTAAQPSPEPVPAEKTLYAKCVALARNLWWAWHPEVITLFQDIDPIRWRALDHQSAKHPAAR